MLRLLMLLTALLLPLQSAWSAASAYCQHERQHETGAPQSTHFGHHFHTHQGDAKEASDSPLTADADCASCHASGTVALPTAFSSTDFAATSAATGAVLAPPFTSAPARAPDRPQWPRLV